MGNPEKRLDLEVGLRRAIEWIGQERRDDAGAKLGVLIDEACRKYDLSPVQADFLYRHFLQASDHATPPSA